LTALVLSLAVPHFWAILIVVDGILLLLALEAIRDRVSAADQYEASLLTTVELNRFALLRSLHLPLPETPSEERRHTWQWSYGTGKKLTGAYVHPARDFSVDEARAIADVLFSEPPLIEYQGWLSAWIESLGGEAMPYADGQFLAEADSECVLVVLIQREPIQGAPTQRIDTGKGEVGVEVPFSISVDSGAVNLPPTPREIVVPARGGTEPLRIAFRTPAEGEHRIFIYALQRSRVLEVLEIRLRSEPRAGTG
jgi:hypothetical protein